MVVEVIGDFFSFLYLFLRPISSTHGSVYSFDAVMEVHGRCMDVHGRCMVNAWKVHGRCIGGAW